MKYVALILLSVFGLASCTATPKYPQHQKIKADLNAWTKCIEHSAKDFGGKDIDALKASRLVLKECSAEQAALDKHDVSVKRFTKFFADNKAYYAVVSAQKGRIRPKTTLFGD